MFHALLESAPWWAWLGFHVLVFAMLALDLGVFNRSAHEPSIRESGLWTAVWIALALAFNGLILKYMGPVHAGEYLAGYLLEKSLSVDNLFVFVLVFTSFQVPRRNQHRVLYWGVLGALVMRAVMILAGTALLQRFAWMTFVFGGFLIYTGVKMLVHRDEEPGDPKDGAVARAFQRVLPFDPEGGFTKLLVRKGGRTFATPMFLVLVVVEVTDLVFAVDSIPAVLAVTRNPFIVYTSNVFAILGLRSLYFLLARMVDRFHHLSIGLAVILALVGVKMCIAEWIHVPILHSLLAIGAILAGCILSSLWTTRPGKGRA
ncbi:TerC family protein [Mesoterricola silvestris]|uniref:Membrane protein n=1 Tax=Mesoterricola silvestris TaxID=2927979 RepID=A0AA48KAN9_9BACT|nr:TerC family protein [Mesoterricola silvestris]BDU74871.1 membrane protein [Mesoterricola silvestris]